ncbi:hypothetical protein VST35_24860, partial [Pseudomonas aeruginosa]
KKTTKKKNLKIKTKIIHNQQKQKIHRQKATSICHQGYSTKRSMLLVWENATPNLPQRYESGELKPYPVDF